MMAFSPRPPPCRNRDLVVVGHGQQFAQIGYCLLVDGDEFGTTVAHFHHRHAAAMPVLHFRGRLRQHFLGQDGGAG